MIYRSLDLSGKGPEETGNFFVFIFLDFLLFSLADVGEEKGAERVRKMDKKNKMETTSVKEVKDSSLKK